MWTKEFWKHTATEGVSAGAQMTLGALVVGDGIFNAFEADWVLAGGAFLGGFIINVLGRLAIVGSAKAVQGRHEYPHNR